MFDELLVCLDGSAAAEKILPLVRGIAEKGARLVLLRIVAAHDDLNAAEIYLTNLASRYPAQIRFLLSKHPAEAIVAEVKKSRGTVAAMTTHGRTGWSETILGSVALNVLTGCARPVILFRAAGNDRCAPKNISAIVVALDGSEFSERILPYAAETACALNANLQLIQTLPIQPPITPGIHQEAFAGMEAAYLHRKADEIKRTYGIATQWEVLHGDPASAICRYASNMPEGMLAMMSHGRSGFKRRIFGSVAGHCLRHAGVPMIIHSSMEAN